MKLLLGLFVCILLSPEVLAFGGGENSIPVVNPGSVIPGSQLAETFSRSGLAADAALSPVTNQLLPLIARVLISIAAGLSIVMTCLAGYFYFGSISNEENINRAHRLFTWSIIGLGISALAYVIVQAVARVQIEGEVLSCGQARQIIEELTNAGASQRDIQDVAERADPNCFL